MNVCVNFFTAYFSRRPSWWEVLILNIAKGTLDPDFQKVSTHMKCWHLIFQAKKFIVLVDNLQKRWCEWQCKPMIGLEVVQLDMCSSCFRCSSSSELTAWCCKKDFTQRQHSLSKLTLHKHRWLATIFASKWNPLQGIRLACCFSVRSGYVLVPNVDGYINIK